MSSALLADRAVHLTRQETRLDPIPETAGTHWLENPKPQPALLNFRDTTISKRDHKCCPTLTMFPNKLIRIIMD